MVGADLFTQSNSSSCQSMQMLTVKSKTTIVSLFFDMNGLIFPAELDFEKMNIYISSLQSAYENVSRFSPYFILATFILSFFQYAHNIAKLASAADQLRDVIFGATSIVNIDMDTVKCFIKDI